VEEAGRTLGDQVRDRVLREYNLDEREHMLDKEYRSDVSHQDGSLPHRMQITYRNGGPQYDTVDYFPHFHFQAAAALADENYDLLQEYWGSNEADSLDDLETGSELIDELAEDGAVESLCEFLD
jgi:hypothetical protein